MSDAEWPVPEPATPRDPERRPAPLPRIEDLPVAEQGYDREKVQEAFDAFYRHAAQLDATLSTLEAVDVFQRTAAELRAELRSIRGSGWTVQSWQGGYGGGGAREWTLPPAFPRVAAEAVFLIVVGVVAGVAGWNRVTIVLVMALALGVVWLIEWVAARERAIPQATAPVTPPVLDEEPSEQQPALEGGAWVVPAEEGPEAMTMLGAPPVREADREEEAEVADDAVEAEALAEPELVAEPEAVGEPELVAEPELVEEPEAVEEPELVEEPEAVEEPALVAEPEPVEGPVGQPDPVAQAEPEPEPAAEPAPEPELVAEPEPGPPPADEALGPTEPPVEPRRRFGLFRRRPVARAEPTAEEKPAEVAAPEAIEDELLDGARALEPLPEPLRAGAVDPWEQEPQLPVEPELGPELEPEPEPEPELEPEPDPEPELELPSEEPADEGPLPVEVLAEQAAAALERSRQRRALARRGRRR